MKLRIMFKRTVQPPVETSAMIDYCSIVIEPNEKLKTFLEEPRSCSMGYEIVGIEEIKEFSDDQEAE